MHSDLQSLLLLSCRKAATPLVSFIGLQATTRSTRTHAFLFLLQCCSICPMHTRKCSAYSNEYDVWSGICTQRWQLLQTSSLSMMTEQETDRICPRFHPFPAQSSWTGMQLAEVINEPGQGEGRTCHRQLGGSPHSEWALGSLQCGAGRGARRSGQWQAWLRLLLKQSAASPRRPWSPAPRFQKVIREDEEVQMHTRAYTCRNYFKVGVARCRDLCMVDPSGWHMIGEALL
jgi:hypothetical protein